MALHGKGSGEGSDLFLRPNQLRAGLQADVPHWTSLEIGSASPRDRAKASIGTTQGQPGNLFPGEGELQRLHRTLLGQKSGLDRGVGDR